MNQVVVYTKPDCCLCDQIKVQLRKLRQTQHFEWAEVNILEDQEAFVKFKDEIPVIFVNGKKAFKYHLDEKQLLRRLRLTTNH